MSEMIADLFEGQALRNQSSRTGVPQTQARKDSEFALSATLKYCADRNMQEAAVKALRFKCDVLWTMLDALTGSVVKYWK